MHERMRVLDDAEAVRILKTIADAQEPRQSDAPEGASEVLPALREAFHIGPEQVEDVGDGELARATLLVYVEDPFHREGLNALLDTPDHLGDTALFRG